VSEADVKTQLNYEMQHHQEAAAAKLQAMQRGHAIHHNLVGQAAGFVWVEMKVRVGVRATVGG